MQKTNFHAIQKHIKANLLQNKLTTRWNAVEGTFRLKLITDLFGTNCQAVCTEQITNLSAMWLMAFGGSNIERPSGRSCTFATLLAKVSSIGRNIEDNLRPRVWAGKIKRYATVFKLHAHFRCLRQQIIVRYVGCCGSN